jgi:hypothetical protein
MIFLSFSRDNGSLVSVGLLPLQFLSQDSATRLGALRRLEDEIGPTGPDPEVWTDRLQAGPLDDEMMEEYFDQLQNSVPIRIGQIEGTISEGYLDKTKLVPNSIGYWEQLCGRCPDGLSQGEWLAGPFSAHRRRLVDRDLARGLDVCLAMNISDELMPRQLVEAVSDDALWEAITSLGPIDDPFSLIGVVDLASARSTSHLGFESLAEETMRRLCATPLRRHDGLDTSAVFSSVLALILSELRVLPEIAGRPAYWRRMCAWTQTALILRVLRGSVFDPSEFATALEPLHSPLSRISDLLELREAPLWHPSDVTERRTASEVIGRLLLLREREAGAGRTLPGVTVLNEAVDALAETAPMTAYLPGPLELHQFPSIRFLEMPEEPRASLRQSAEDLTTDLESSDWARFAHLSRLIRFDEPMMSRLTHVVGDETALDQELGNREAFVRLIPIAFIAVAQRCGSLAAAVLSRCLRKVSPQTDGAYATALFKLGVIATAAFEDPITQNERLATFLRGLAARVPIGEPCQALVADFVALKTLTPVNQWHEFSRAEALVHLGC